MKESQNIFKLDEFNCFWEKSNPKHLEYKSNYFFRNESDTQMYEILINELGKFLCLYTNLFKFDSFVMSTHPFRLYKINDNYKELNVQYCQMFKDIYDILQDVKLSSVSQAIKLLNDHGYNCYRDQQFYPIGHWHGYTKKIPTLYIENKDNLKIIFPYYYAKNIRYNIIQKSFKSIINCF